MADVPIDKVKQIAAAFDQLQALNKEKHATLAKMFELCLVHLRPPSPFRHAEDIRKRNAQRKELVETLPKVIAMLKGGDDAQV